VARNLDNSSLNFMISLTDSAITHLKSLIAEKNASTGTGLRLRVEKGGCAGMQYVMGLDQSAPEDSVITQDDVKIIIDHESLGFLRGSQIDYVDSLADSGFKLTNPNATRSCGCGTSFEPLTD
jgi:iron-sulfur cluster assembly protein